MNINKLLNDITLINGDTKRMDCPECNGKKTFTITNNMGSIVWNCYKAGCTVSGGRRIHLSSDDIRKSLGKTVSEIEGIPKFTKPEWIVRDTDKIASYCDKWSLNAEELGLLYDVKEHRVVFPVMHNGHTVDATGRSLGKRLPKWKRYGNSGLPYVHGCGKVAVVVEDCVSAAVVGGDRHTGVALMGTSMSNEQRQYLAQFSTAVVALDPDASKKTLAIAKELRSVVDNVKVLRLQDDIKYRQKKDMDALNEL